MVAVSIDTPLEFGKAYGVSARGLCMTKRTASAFQSGHGASPAVPAARAAEPTTFIASDSQQAKMSALLERLDGENAGKPWLPYSKAGK